MTQRIMESKKKNNEEDQYAKKLIHLVYVVGEIALKFLYYFEKMDKQLQNRRNKAVSNQGQDEL